MVGTSIIILSYNTLKLTRLCIESIRKYTQTEPYEIIVVDNASTDGSVSWLKKQRDLHCIFNTENKGFPAGCNQGLQIAAGSELLLLNSDVVVTPRWLTQLKRALYSRKEIGVVGCVTNRCSNLQQITVPYEINDMESMEKFAEDYNHTDSHKWTRRLVLIGFCYLFKRDVYERLGGLDELFSPGNFEDEDYTLRIWQAGYEAILCSDTFIHHFGSSSFMPSARKQKSQHKEEEKDKFVALMKCNQKKMMDKWNLPADYKVGGLKEIFPEWRGPEVERLDEIISREQKKRGPFGYDLPVELFSSGIVDPEEERFKPLLMMDKLSGAIKGETGIPGLMLDFCAGIRLRVPEGLFHVVIKNAETGQIFYDRDVSAKILVSLERYCIYWQVEVYLSGELVFQHDFDPAEQEVLFDIYDVPLGSGLMLLPYIQAFQAKHHCKAVCRASKPFQEVIRKYYPDIQLQEAVSEDTYAAYYLGAWQEGPYAIPDGAGIIPWNYIGRTLLNLNYDPEIALLVPQGRPPVKERYVCIGVQASSLKKYWHYPQGWDVIVEALKEMGYRVLCIDKEPVYYGDDYVMKKPDNVEDFTGEYSLLERINQLAYADFYIGMSSGLAWLARAVGTPVVCISGHSLPQTEFPTPYRVINRNVCHGCYNEPDGFWAKSVCPHHGGTEREFECTKMIAPQQVMEKIRQLLEDREHERTKCNNPHL